MTESAAGPKCNFCGRFLIELPAPGRMIQKDDSWICESCIRSCYELLQEDIEEEGLGGSPGLG